MSESVAIQPPELPVILRDRRFPLGFLRSLGVEKNNKIHLVPNLYTF